MSLLNQGSTIDPYVYTGYIHNSGDLLSRYGLTYYSVRFGLILPAKAFTLAFGPEAGYLALRYVLTLLAGIPLYALIRRHMGVCVAVLTYCALITRPVFQPSAVLGTIPTPLDGRSIPSRGDMSHRARTYAQLGLGHCGWLSFEALL